MRLILFFGALFGHIYCLETFVGLIFGNHPPPQGRQPTSEFPSSTSRQSKCSWSPRELPIPS
uniref:Carboxypeptidase A2 isoform 5 n=3 Tax=Homininae TaxID=207598 RepID=A0A0S2Z3R5_HUMAN|nr:carboxypeptidase A2 isoform 5 [Homo sapiens]